jgi:hypothetical protein
MAPAHDNFEKGLPAPEVDSGSDKARVQEIDAVGAEPAPEFIRNWTPEERHAAEKRLKAKIDLRLMPMIILMYIMNYLDRASNRDPLKQIHTLKFLEQYCRCQTGGYPHRFASEGFRIQCT